MQHAISDDTERELRRGEWTAWAIPVLVALGFVWWYSLIWWLLLPSSPPRVAEAVRANQTLTASAQKMGSTSSAFITNPGENFVSISRYLNREIHNRFGEKLGTIQDVLIGPDGRFHAAVLAISRDLGIGSKDIAVPFAALHVVPGSGGARLVLDATRDALRNAPAFEARPMPRQ